LLSPGELREIFASQTGVPLNLLRGQPFGEGDFSFRADPYGLRAGPEYRPTGTLLSDLSHLWIWKAARFSNSLTQLSNVFSLAWKHRVPNIVVPNLWYLAPGLSKVSDDLDLINLSGGQELEPEGRDLVLKGRFFYRETLKDLYERDNKAEVIARIRHLFNLDLNQPALPSDNLVIHLRSGDIFRGSGVHVSFGQPPLAFYQKVIEGEKPRKIYLVFEDMGNPVIAPLAEYAADLGLEVETVSGSLRSDIEFLARGRVLAVGRGSFMSAITTLSHNARKVYYFDSMYSDWGKEGIEQVRLRDVGGGYSEKVLSRWQNSLEQRQMMLSWPLALVGL